MSEFSYFKIFTILFVVKIELLCVIGTPFGLVVVPEVYIK